jgi:hypothetical protein
VSYAAPSRLQDGVAGGARRRRVEDLPEIVPFRIGHTACSASECVYADVARRATTTLTLIRRTTMRRLMATMGIPTLLGTTALACGGAAAPDDVQQQAAASSESSVSSIGTAFAGSTAVTGAAYVASERANDPLGSLGVLMTGGADGNLRRSFIKATVGSVSADATSVKSTLTVHATAGGPGTVNAHCGMSNDWNSSTLTWDNQPAYDSAVLSSVPSVSAPGGTSFDVSGCVKRNGTFTIVLDAPAGANVEYDGLSASADSPSLAISARTSGHIVFGMYNNTAIPPGTENPTLANNGENFRDITQKWYPTINAKMNVHRVFDSGLPKSYADSAGATDPENHLVSFLSVKPPGDDAAGVAAVTKGEYDSEIAALAASIPAGSYFTMYHEPENNMDGPTFVAMFKQFYKVAKGANDELTIGYVALGYEWRKRMSKTQDEDSWYPGDDSTDFLAIDTYEDSWEGPRALDTADDFQRWYPWASGHHKPIVIAEYGVELACSADAGCPGGGFSDEERASLISQSMQYADSLPDLGMMLYWNGTAATPGGINHYLNPTTSEPVDHFTHARDAWITGVTAYGSTGTSL